MAATAAACGIISGLTGMTVATLLLCGVNLDETTMLVLLGFAALNGLGLMLFLGMYMYYDARSRGMSGALSALMLFLVGPPALVIYLLVRKPRLSPPAEFRNSAAV